MRGPGALVETQKPLTVGVAKPHRAAQRRPFLVVNAAAEQHSFGAETHWDQVNRPMAGRCGRPQHLDYRFRVPDATGSPEFSEVQMQERELVAESARTRGSRSRSSRLTTSARSPPAAMSSRPAATTMASIISHQRHLEAGLVRSYGRFEG